MRCRRRTRAPARRKRFALAVALALGLAVASGAAQDRILTNGQNLQIPINHGLPDKPLGFTFCRLRYQNIRRARKSGWGDDYPQADYNFMVRLAELTTTTISRWNNGYPGFANVTALDPDLFRCPYLRMQNAANYDFTSFVDGTLTINKANATVTASSANVTYTGGAYDSYLQIPEIPR